MANDKEYFWWNAGEIGPTLLSKEELEKALTVTYEDSIEEPIAALDAQGFWMGWVANAATIVIDRAALYKHGGSIVLIRVDRDEQPK